MNDFFTIFAAEIENNIVLTNKNKEQW